MIHLIAQILVVLFMVVGVLLVPLGLPGTWVIVLAGVVYSLFYPFDGGSGSAWWTNGILIGLALFGEAMEFGVNIFGAKPLKVSNGAIWSALIGGIVGAIIGVPVFLIGSLIGLFIGAFLGAFCYELIVLKSIPRAFVNACAVLTTRIVSMSLKTTLAIGMAVYLFFKLF